MKTNKIDHIWQEDTTGCGLAVVAMITGNTYQQVKRKAIKKRITTKSFFGTRSFQIRKLLKLYGYAGRRKKKFKKWREIPSSSIVATNFQNNGWFHWVLFIRSENDCYLLDPWHKKCDKKRDFRGMGIGYYISIEKIK
jgi:ABC-type bacteriocin/lantibiotic exporter with double-glycine peptidase domain